MSDIDDVMNAEQERAFLEWRDLRAKADQTQDMADAHAAGKAFAAFFYCYVANTYRPSATTGYVRNEFGRHPESEKEDYLFRALRSFLERLPTNTEHVEVGGIHGMAKAGRR